MPYQEKSPPYPRERFKLPTGIYVKFKNSINPEVIIIKVRAFLLCFGLLLSLDFLNCEENKRFPTNNLIWEKLNSAPKGMSIDAALMQPKCFGQDMNNFVLDQFVEVKDQGDEGTCYSYAATANIEAALYRQTGTRRSLSREYATVSHCLRPEKRNYIGILDKIHTPDSEGGYNSFFDGDSQLGNIESLLNQERAPWDLPPNKKAKLQKYYTELKLKIEKLSSEIRLKTDPLVARRNELQTEKEKLENEKEQLKRYIVNTEMPHETFENLKKKYIEIINHLGMIDDEINNNNRTLEELTTPNGKKICEEGVGCYLRKINENTEKANLRDLKLNRDTDSDLEESKSSECNSSYNSQVISKIMRNLCIGVPVAASVTNTKINTKNSSNKNSEEKFVDAHAMVIKGVKTIEGIPHFVFRNSWGKNAEETTLSFWEACKIKHTGSVLNTAPLQGDSISERHAWINSSTEKPRTPDTIASYEFFRSRLGKFIKIDQERFADEKAPEYHRKLPPLPFTSTNKHKSGKK